MTWLDKLRNYINKIEGFRISAMLLIESGIEDTVLTLESISKYGVEIEGNPVLREIVRHMGPLPGLLITKTLVIAITLYTAYMMNKTNYKIKGEYLLYGASIYWLCGALSHLLID
jgi:hypothetical protein